MRHGLSGVPLLLCCACDPHEADVPPFEAPSEVFVVPNLDDDDGDGVMDWEDSPLANDDDRARALLWADDGALTLRLEGEARVYRAGELVLDAEQTEATVEVGGDVLLEFEVPDFLSVATVHLAWEGLSGDREEAEIAVRGAPLVLNHHLQAAEQIYAMDSGSRSNADFIAGFQDVLGQDFSGFDLNDYGFDVWIQDEIELGTATAPGQRLDVIIDSVRSQQGRHLDDLPEDQLLGPDVWINTWGSGQPSSQDSFGNMEVLPPVTVDGVAYPFGRIYYGLWHGGGPKQELIDELTAQGMQDPFTLDVTFLCVGHVDEFFTTIPDPSADKGFRVLLADTDLGRSFLSSLDPATALDKYENLHGYASIGEIVEDEALWAYNEDIQRDYIEPNLEILAAEGGVEESDIIRIPAVFEANSYCGGYGLSLIPGTVNLTVAQIDPDGPVHLFLPDPFLREDEDDQGADPLIAYVNALLPATVEPHWLNDWRQYHAAMGEVHCGSNAMRTPSPEAWTRSLDEEG